MNDVSPLVGAIGAGLGMGWLFLVLVSLFAYFALPLLALVLVINVRQLRQQAEVLNTTLDAMRREIGALRSTAPAAPDAPTLRLGQRAASGPTGL